MSGVCVDKIGGEIRLGFKFCSIDTAEYCLLLHMSAVHHTRISSEDVWYESLLKNYLTWNPTNLSRSSHTPCLFSEINRELLILGIACGSKLMSELNRENLIWLFYLLLKLWIIIKSQLCNALVALKSPQRTHFKVTINQNNIQIWNI